MVHTSLIHGVPERDPRYWMLLDDRWVPVIAGGAGEYQTSDYNIPPATSSGSSIVLPEVAHQETTANLADQASIDFDFNADYYRNYYMLVFANQALVVRVFVRQSSSDTFRQLGPDILTTASAMSNPLNANDRTGRIPGSQVRIRLFNNSGALTTTLSAQVHAGSLR